MIKSVSSELTLTEDLWLPMAETVEMVEPIVTEKAQVLMKNASEIVQNVVENVPIKPYSLTLEESNLWHPFWDLRDTRLDGWFLMSSPWPVLAICILYWFIVRIVGPRFMRDRPPYDVQKIMIVYNFCQTFFSLWIFSGTCYFFLTGRYNWICQPVDYSENYDGYYAANITWWYFFSKFTDFFDTVFFVLRKKFNQCSTLHVVHHGIMPFTTWWVTRFVGGGHSIFAGFLNMGIHVIMYFYYLMSAMGPEVQKYLWWKKYLTSMQLVQFVLVFIHAMVPIFYDCNFPKVFSYVILSHGAMFFVLFTNFYIQAYMKKGSKVSKVSTNGVQANGVKKHE